MDKEKIAKLLIPLGTAYTPTSPSSYAIQVDMGSFVNNTTDLAFLQLEECSNITCSYNPGYNADGTRAPIYNFVAPIRIEIDIPQQDSVDPTTGSMVYELVLLNRNARIQDVIYDAMTWPFTPRMWQSWEMQLKPQRIALRPEVFQQKVWHINIYLEDSNSTLLSSLFAGITPPTLVFSVTK